MNLISRHEIGGVVLVGIYKIENKVNGKVYIGESMNIENRWSQHKKVLNENKHHSYKLQRDWNKYGEDNFIFEVLLNVECAKNNTIRKTLCLLKEEEYISKLNSVQCGYNIKSSSIKDACLKREIGVSETYINVQRYKLKHGHFIEVDGCLVEEIYSIKDMHDSLNMKYNDFKNMLIDLGYYITDGNKFKLKYKNYLSITIFKTTNKCIGSELYNELRNELYIKTHNF